jgi:SNF2 family DNA or RNA helicase
MPTSLLYNWEKEAKKFTPTLRVLIYAGSSRKKDVKNFAKYDLVLTSYGITRIDIEVMKEFYFNYVILDESQNIKNPQSNIAKAVSQLKSRRRLVLTGTPVENTTMDLWSQMNFLNPGLLGTQNFFKDEYQIPIEKYGDDKKRNKLHVITKPFILRRHKSQVAKDLPEKFETIHYCTMSEEQEKLYEEVKSTYRNQLMEMIEEAGMKRSHFMILQGLMKLRQLANHPRLTDGAYKGDSGKLEDVLYALENALQGDHKILIFSQFVKHLEIIKEELDKRQVQYTYLDGATRDRQGEVDRFQKDKSIKVFLISLKAGGVGLNLTAADYVFLLDPWWNPAVEAQAIDRAYRIGQENKVFVYKFITRNSVEEKILALQQNKKKLATDLITTEESIMKQLSKNDIEALLS